MDAVSLRQAVAVLLWRVFVDPFISARGAALSAESPAGRAASLAALPAFYAYFFVFRPRRGSRLTSLQHVPEATASNWTWDSETGWISTRRTFSWTGLVGENCVIVFCPSEVEGVTADSDNRYSDLARVADAGIATIVCVPCASLGHTGNSPTSSAPPSGKHGHAAATDFREYSALKSVELLFVDEVEDVNGPLEAPIASFLKRASGNPLPIASVWTKFVVLEDGCTVRRLRPESNSVEVAQALNGALEDASRELGAAWFGAAPPPPLWPWRWRRWGVGALQAAAESHAAHALAAAAAATALYLYPAAAADRFAHASASGVDGALLACAVLLTLDTAARALLGDALRPRRGRCFLTGPAGVLLDLFCAFNLCLDISFLAGDWAERQTDPKVLTAIRAARISRVLRLWRAVQAWRRRLARSPPPLPLPHAPPSPAAPPPQADPGPASPTHQDPDRASGGASADSLAADALDCGVAASGACAVLAVALAAPYLTQTPYSAEVDTLVSVLSKLVAAKYAAIAARGGGPPGLANPIGDEAEAACSLGFSGAQPLFVYSGGAMEEGVPCASADPSLADPHGRFTVAREILPGLTVLLSTAQLHWAEGAATVKLASFCLGALIALQLALGSALDDQVMRPMSRLWGAIAARTAEAYASMRRNGSDRGGFEPDALLPTDPFERMAAQLQQMSLAYQMLSAQDRGHRTAAVDRFLRNEGLNDPATRQWVLGQTGIDTGLNASIPEGSVTTTTLTAPPPNRRSGRKSNTVVPSSFLDSQSSLCTSGLHGSRLLALATAGKDLSPAAGAPRRASGESRVTITTEPKGSLASASDADPDAIPRAQRRALLADIANSSGSAHRSSAVAPGRSDSSVKGVGLLGRMLQRVRSIGDGAAPSRSGEDQSAATPGSAHVKRMGEAGSPSDGAAAGVAGDSAAPSPGHPKPFPHNAAPSHGRSSLKSAVRVSSVGFEGGSTPSSSPSTLDFSSGAWESPCPVSEEAFAIYESLGVFRNGYCFKGTMWVFIVEVCALYRNNPFHNFRHAVDILHATATMLRAVEKRALFQPLEVFALSAAALAHDVDHPGVTNAFLVNTYDPLAVQYNDIAVLESHHLATLFRLFQSNPLTNVFSRCNRVAFRGVRKLILDAVGHTDMAKHFPLVSKAEAYASVHAADLQLSARGDEAASERLRSSSEDRVFLLSLLLHCADISNPARPKHVQDKWASCVCSEFFAQGDREKQLGLPVSPGFDRAAATVEMVQVNFAEFIVLPVYCELTKIFPELAHTIAHLRRNYQQYVDVEASRAKSPEQTATLEKRRAAVEKKAAAALALAHKALSKEAGGGGAGAGLPAAASPEGARWLSMFLPPAASLERPGAGAADGHAAPGPFMRLPRPSWVGNVGAAILEAAPLRALAGSAGRARRSTGGGGNDDLPTQTQQRQGGGSSEGAGAAPPGGAQPAAALAAVVVGGHGEEGGEEPAVLAGGPPLRQASVGSGGGA